MRSANKLDLDNHEPSESPQQPHPHEEALIAPIRFATKAQIIQCLTRCNPAAISHDLFEAFLKAPTPRLNRPDVEDLHRKHGLQYNSGITRATINNRDYMKALHLKIETESERFPDRKRPALTTWILISTATRIELAMTKDNTPLPTINNPSPSEKLAKTGTSETQLKKGKGVNELNATPQAKTPTPKDLSESSPLETMKQKKGIFNSPLAFEIAKLLAESMLDKEDGLSSDEILDLLKDTRIGKNLTLRKICAIIVNLRKTLKIINFTVETIQRRRKGSSPEKIFTLVKLPN